MNEKKNYNPPIVEVSYLEIEDIITSGGIVLPDDNWD